MITSYLVKPDKTISKDIAVKEFSSVLKDPKNLLWVDVEKPGDDDIDILLNDFGIHPLTIEDCVMPNDRPKLETFDTYTAVILHAIGPRSEESLFNVEEIDILFSKNFIITVHATPLPSISKTKEKFEKSAPNIFKGSDFLLYTIIDNLIDNYFPLIDRIDAKADMLEDKLFDHVSQEIIDSLFNTRKDIMRLRRTVIPQREVINSITRLECNYVRSQNYVYFRDIYDQLSRLLDLIDTCRDIISAALEAHVTMTSSRMNEIMKSLTIVATIMMPLTLITGIYGMNFKYMPEIDSPLGYFVIWGIMISLAVAMIAYFKRRKWM